VFGSSKLANGRFRANCLKLANDNNNPALAGFPSVTRVFMPRYYYFLAYLLWLVMVLGTHDVHAARKDTILNPFTFTFTFTDQTGVDADTDPAAFEPHHELITSPDQVQVYEAIMGDDMNQVTYTLLRGMTYLKDNRILPQGFDKASASSDIRVVGDALNDDNFIGGSDEIGYRIAGLNGTGYQVTAELIHQPLAYGFTQAVQRIRRGNPGLPENVPGFQRKIHHDNHSRIQRFTLGDFRTQGRASLPYYRNRLRIMCSGFPKSSKRCLKSKHVCNADLWGRFAHILSL
jgi:hypothetical protein